jgi:hypothetical protein
MTNATQSRNLIVLSNKHGKFSYQARFKKEILGHTATSPTFNQQYMGFSPQNWDYGGLSGLTNKHGDRAC